MFPPIVSASISGMKMTCVLGEQDLKDAGEVKTGQLARNKFS
jgi:hypothetical protein